MNAAILRGLGLASGSGRAVYGLPWAAVTSAVQPKRERESDLALPPQAGATGVGSIWSPRKHGCRLYLPCGWLLLLP